MRAEYAADRLLRELDRAAAESARLSSQGSEHVRNAEWLRRLLRATRRDILTLKFGLETPLRLLISELDGNGLESDDDIVILPPNEAEPQIPPQEPGPQIPPIEIKQRLVRIVAQSDDASAVAVRLTQGTQGEARSRAQAYAKSLWKRPAHNWGYQIGSPKTLRAFMADEVASFLDQQRPSS